MELQTFYENFLNNIGNYLPGVLGALLVLLIGWLIALGISSLFARLVRQSGLDKRLQERGSDIQLARTVKKFVYYILMAVVLLVVLEMLGVENVLRPLEEMVAEFLSFLPNIIAALVIGFVGYVLATIVSELVGLASGAIERFADRFGLTGSFDVTKLLKQVLFLLIFIPILIVALDTLNMKAISDPATMMLSELINAIPNILAAAIILIVFFIVGRYVTQILRQLLENLNTDELPARTGLSGVLGGRSLSKLLADVAFFFIIFFGVITAVEKLEFTQMSALLRDMLELSGRIFFGLVILAIGNFIAKIAHDALASSNGFIASLARVAVLALFLAIALRQMGIADDIINLAFGLTLGAIAVAIALSFGLGGREAAGKQMEHLLSRLRGERKDS
jgi:hypothetical protein